MQGPALFTDVDFSCFSSASGCSILQHLACFFSVQGALLTPRNSQIPHLVQLSRSCQASVSVV